MREDPGIDSGGYFCLWADCQSAGHEFESQRALVDHVTEAHVESAKKGTEERPCLWKVSEGFCSVEELASNAFLKWNEHLFCDLKT